MKHRCPLLFLWGMALLVSCTDTESNTPREIKRTPVEIIQVFKEPLEEVMNLIGTVEADREMKVSFKIGGKLKRIEFEEGDLVKKGSLLAELDNTELLARKEKAIANKNKARRDQGRMENLYKNNIVPLSSVQDAKTLYVSAQTELKIIEENLRNSLIKAPFTGRITRKLFEVEEIVSPGTPVAILTEMDPVVVKAAVPDNFIRKITIGGMAEVQVDSYPEERFTGTIVSLDTTADPLSRTFRMEIRLSNETEKLRPGLIAHVKVAHVRKDPAMLIPLDVVVGFGTEPSVFVVKDSKAMRRIIKTGGIFGERVEVLEGLAPGDNLVVSGQEYLRDGGVVEIIKTLLKGGQ